MSKLVSPFVDFRVRTAAELEALDISSFTESYRIFLDWEGNQTLTGTITLPAANTITLMIYGRGYEATQLTGPTNQPVFSTASVDWTNTNTLIFEDFEITGDSDECGDFSFNKFFFLRVTFSGIANNNAKMTTFGGSGAPGKTGSLIDCNWAHGGGVTTNYICRIWGEAVVVINPLMLLKSSPVTAVDGLFEIFGTSVTFIKTTIHHWANRNITTSAFYLAGATVAATVIDVYDNDSGGGAPTTAAYFKILNTQPDSRFYVSGNFRHHEEDSTKIMADAFTSIRTKYLAQNWQDTLVMPTSISIPFIQVNDNFVAHATPGVAYAEFDADNRKSKLLDMYTKAKIIGVAQSPGSGGAGPGVCVYNITDGAVLVEHTWSGNALEIFETDPVDISSLTGSKSLSTYTKTDGGGNVNLYNLLLVLYN